MIWKRALILSIALAVISLAVKGGYSLYRELQPQASFKVPTTLVKRGEVTFTVTAKGALQGGNSKMLAAPMTGSNQLVLTTLRKPGETVGEGDIIAQFDTTEENYKLLEAEADLAEAEQQVLQASSEAQAREEELNYELLKARSDQKLAELETRRNPLLAAITARQNELAFEAARERLLKLEADYPSRKAAAKASIAIQEAAQKKATVQADVARRNIDMMTLKAPVGGYVNVERNTNSNWYFSGMQFPLFQIGDQVRAGMAVAQIPDLSSWEVTAQINEQDRGHLSLGLPAEIYVVALPGRKFKGKITNLGGTTGPMWDRRFECKLSLEDAIAELRPGLSAKIVITTQTIKDALWIPASALFESDGKSFVYLEGTKGYQRKDVKMLRRSESQVVLEGLKEGEMIAMASPDQKVQSATKGGDKGGAAKAIAK